MSLPEMSLDLGSAWAEKAGQGEVGRCTRRVQTVWPRLDSSLEATCLVGTGRATSILFGINGVRNQRSHLVGPPFPEFKARFSPTAGWHFSRDLTRRLLIGGCGHENRNWGTFKSCREWKWLWEENLGPNELSLHGYSRAATITLHFPRSNLDGGSSHSTGRPFEDCLA